MVQTFKTILLFDYDSIYRSLNQRRPGAGDQLGARAGAWLEAIETGDLIVPRQDNVRRRLAVKRCYTDPKVLGKNRGWLTANGVQIVDSPALPGHPRTPADTHMVVDVLDALADGSEFEEFILLTAEADLTPLLIRLRAANRRIVTYAAENTAQSYRTLSDAVVGEDLMLTIIGRLPGDVSRPAAASSVPRPEPVTPRVPPPAEPILAASAAPVARPVPAGPIEKEALAALVRRIHQATSVPLFSPKAFADLFRLLSAEVAENGYRFQSTAENVAARMNALGRNVTKRQVGFVVKGLALRGHVFTAADTAARLGELFYDQVLYLTDNAKLELSDAEKGLVLAWIVGFGGRPDEAGAPQPEIAATPAPRPQPRIEARPAEPAASRTETPRPAAERPPLRQEPPRTEPARTEPARSEAARTETLRPTPPRTEPASRPSATSRPATPARPLEERPGLAHSEPPASETPLAPDRARPLRPATPARPATPPRSAPLDEPAAEGPVRMPPGRAASPPPAAEKPRNGATRPAARALDERDKSEIEDSILAAIADAVDVLVEDRSTDRPRPAQPAQIAASSPAPRAAAPARAEPPPPVDESDDIGDEIQRILASYSKNR